MSPSGSRDGAGLRTDVVLFPILRVNRVADRLIGFADHVEDMVVALALHVLGDARLLEKVGRGEGTEDGAFVIELDVEMLAKA